MLLNNASYRAVWIAAFMIVGCSGGEDANRKAVYKVTGKVTMAGGPLANAIVTFSPTDKQPVALGRTDVKGQFKLTTYDSGDGAAEGNYVVLVSKPAAAAAKVGPNAHDSTAKSYDSEAAHSQQTASESSADVGIPDKYGRIDASDLRVKVEKSGKNEFNFELK